MSAFDQQTQASKNFYKDLNLETINTFLNDPNYVLTASTNLIQNGFIDEGLQAVKKIHIKNPRNLDALNILVITYEQTNKISEAIMYREKISNLDPWNAANYLALGKDYKIQGDLIKTKEMLDKILSFASGKQVAEQAKIDLAL